MRKENIYLFVFWKYIIIFYWVRNQIHLIGSIILNYLFVESTIENGGDICICFWCGTCQNKHKKPKYSCFLLPKCVRLVLLCVMHSCIQLIRFKFNYYSKFLPLLTNKQYGTLFNIEKRKWVFDGVGGRTGLLLKCSQVTQMVA